MTKIITPATLLAATLALAAMPAAAKPIASTASTEVFYGDLDLDRADHARELEQRLRTAAADVCSRLAPTRGDIGDLRCRTNAMVDARRELRARR